MEAYLDWQKKSGGIKLNDVIEEYRYVANGKSVKEGDFLTYIGEDVAPAIEPPFNAVALSSGVGAPEFVEGEVKKTGNIFAKTWNEVTLGTEYMADDGTILSASSNYSSTDNISKACDNNAKTNFQSNSGTTHWIKIKLPNAIKITKMATYIGLYNPGLFTNAIIQGSNDDSSWNDLYTITSEQNALSEITLNNPDYYQYYQILVNLPAATRVNVFEWQTTEYIEKTIVPSTAHNQQVKIARIYKEVTKEVTKTGNIFPTSGWNEEVTGTKYSSSDGWTITASGYSSDSSIASNAFDGDEANSPWTSATGTASWIKIESPEPIKITKMNTKFNAVSEDYISSAKIQGSNDDSKWTNLGSITHYQTSLETIELSNVDFYKYYRMYITLTTSSKAFVYELQTSEYIEKVTEVIQ